MFYPMMMERNHEAQVKRSFELERIIFFSDAVFAIAITLLALELHVPDLSVQSSDALLNALANDGARFFAFFLSFWIIAAFWQSHHRYFRYIVRYDDGLIRRNFLVLFFIVLVPFTSLVLGEFGSVPAANWLYAANMFAVSAADGLMWHYAAAGHRMIEPNLDAREIQYTQVRSLVTAAVAVVVFLLSNALAQYANIGWVLIIPLQQIIRRRYAASTKKSS